VVLLSLLLFGDDSEDALVLGFTRLLSESGHT
jgi:hypothetical protein